MINIKINPQNFDQIFIDNTNIAYKSELDIKDYNWRFHRKIGGFDSDIIIIEKDGEVIAGSGITYRKISINRSIIDIAIMTSSWTLPAARKTGCFTKIIDMSRKICIGKNVPFLTAFVTEDNASYRRLKNKGSHQFASYYLFSSFKNIDTKQKLRVSLLDDHRNIEEVFYNRENMLNRYSSFYYSNIEEFESQFYCRAEETSLLKVNNDFAIIEETSDIIKLLFLTYDDINSFKKNINSIVVWAYAQKNKNILFYTTNYNIYKTCMSLDFNNKNGYFTVLSLNENKNSNAEKNIFGFEADLNIAYGDKM